MARILDFYEVRWEYEPTTFPILWNLEGDVIESFAPDFYLPDLELFLEMTTLKQRLVRKKNRKLRRLRALYPDIRIKLFYARDFRAMMLKYGRLGLAESLTGTPGQVVPQRPPVSLDGDEAAALDAEADVAIATAPALGKAEGPDLPAPAVAALAAAALGGGTLDAATIDHIATGPTAAEVPRAAPRGRTRRRRRHPTAVGTEREAKA